MKRTLSRFPSLNFGLLLLTLVFIAAAAVPDAAVATAAPIDNTEVLVSSQNGVTGVISARESTVEWTAVQQPWTKSRMLAAQPFPLPRNNATPSSLSERPVPSGDPVLIPSIPPDNSSPAYQAENGFDILAGDSLLGFDYPAPFTRYENFDDYKVFPYSTVGVLFFSQNGKDYRCSAASIGSNALWTAGHCVHDGSGSVGGWSDNVVFAPAYKNGDTPLGIWTFYDLVTRVAWFSGGDFRLDIGGVILEPNASAKTVNEIVGSLGFAYNLNPNQHWFNIGYPVGAPFDGKTMQICAASFARNAPSYTSPIPMAMGCDMTPGSSGGPWIIDFSGSPGNTNYINGNNSYRYTGLEEEIYSPYFSDAAKDLLAYISPYTRLFTNINIHLPIIYSNQIK
jgi:V8-like Glu-specific endopeptidase